jgi:ATP-dependent exoDNAse (exonuclease V) alpha subunit
MLDESNTKNINKNTFKNQVKGQTVKNVCFFNETRKRVNTQHMNKMVKEKHKQLPFELPKLPWDGNSQNVKLLSGMPIIARVDRDSLNICNNDMFVIEEIQYSTATTEILSEDNKTIKIPFNEFQKLFYIAFCITTHESQGSTFAEPYTIYDWDHMDETLKYVALSRTIHKNNINAF